MRKWWVFFIPLSIFLVALAPDAPPYALPAIPVYSTPAKPTPTTPPQAMGLQQEEAPPWFGQYFNNRFLQDPPAGEREDGCISFNWGLTSPWPGRIGADDFSVRWTKRQYFEPGLYRFHVITDDGARFWIDPEVNNFTIIDAWRDQPPTHYSTEIQLQGGTNSLKLEYYDRVAIAQIEFWWEKRGVYPNWKAEYYNYHGTPRLCDGPVLTRNELEINHQWGTGSPSPLLGNDFWAARWTGTAQFVGGLTRFFTLSDDGVRLWVDANDNGSFDDPGEFIIDKWIDQSLTLWSGDIYLMPGDHRVKLEYYELVGDATVMLWWRNW